MSKKFNIVFGGGGALGISYLGVYKGFSDNPDMLTRLKGCAGSSIGAICAFCLVAGIAHAKVVDLVIAGRTNIFGSSDQRDFASMIGDWGVTDMGALRVLLLDLVKDHFGSDITFMELFRITGKKLVVTVTNISQKEVQYISHETLPGITVVNALCMTCCIPYVFPPCEYKGELYIDGGVSEMPIEVFWDEMDVPLCAVSLPISPPAPLDGVISYSRAIFDSVVGHAHLSKRLRTQDLIKNYKEFAIESVAGGSATTLSNDVSNVEIVLMSRRGYETFEKLREHLSLPRRQDEKINDHENKKP
jgi:predicted acylesterase/phospholipase RssA